MFDPILYALGGFAVFGITVLAILAPIGASRLHRKGHRR